MADNSGLMDWSPGGIAHDLSAPAHQLYYRDLAMPGGFPWTPPRPSTPLFEGAPGPIDDGILYNASKRLCSTVARVANTASASSMISIIRSVKFMQSRMRFSRRTPLLVSEGRSTRSGLNDQDAAPDLKPFESPLAKAGQEADQGLHAISSQEGPTRSIDAFINRPTLRPSSRPSLVDVTPPEQSNIEPPKPLASPFPILKATYGATSPSLASSPGSSPVRQLVAEVHTAANDSDDSASISFDSKWMSYRIPSVQIQKPSPVLPTDVSSAVRDTRDWYHDPIQGWIDLADLTDESSPKNGVKSISGLEIENLKISSARTRKALAKAKFDAGDTSRFDIKPLSKQWEAKVDTALKIGHGRLQARDFQKIVPPKGKFGVDAWLNDESINEYLHLVTAHANKGLKENTPPRMHAFSTFFYTSLMTGGYQKVARWAKRAKIAGAALLEVDKIFIPINPNQSHWTLAVIQPKLLRITHYNSLGSGSRAYLEMICEWLRGELGAGFVQDDWILDYHAESPQQANTSDCGVFTVTTAKQLMLGLSPLTYSARDIPTQRRRMVAELVNGELLQNQ